MANRTDRRGHGPELIFDSPTIVRVRCTVEQREAWDARASAAGLSLSEWIRRVADAAARHFLDDRHDL